jgi:CobQ-like glutamine amidotransferase family enzyme
MLLKICHLYPDVLNLYGDRGNIACLRQRLLWRGIGAEVTELPVGQNADFTSFDIFFIGGGQDFEQRVLLDDIAGKKAADIQAAIEDERVFLAICGGYQMLGKYYKSFDGVQYDFIGAIDFYTIGERKRMIGNYMFQCTPESGGSLVAGFENHSGRTFLGSGAAPLGHVLKGHGNNGKDGSEGARYKNTFCSYSHGPLLPKNPEFADFLLRAALRRKYPDASLPPLEDTAELRAHAHIVRRLS